ncbi:MAG: type II toxin-antitoxin system RelE/ParE family toxin [Candidatus Margulisbacteria bacterium]|jgi:putative addiction module killer protein|nr:type II toxin-antitoxin system RelE/ParE family toxin [Candidatus Margulisiibacteriota bacterium]
MEVKTTSIFDEWLLKLKDRQSAGLIVKHIDRMRRGNLGNVKNVGGNLFEKKMHQGAGYRLYFVNKNSQLIIILCGGDKSTQQKDIEKAKQIIREI